MKSIIATTIAVLGLGTAAVAAAAAPEQGFYLGGVFSQADLKISGVSGSVSPTALAVQGGWKFNKNFSAEVRLGTGAGDDSIQGAKFKVDSYYSGFLRGTVPVNDMVNCYALAGYTNGKFKVSGALTGSGSDSSFSYGIGGEVKVGERGGVSLEWGRLLSGDFVPGTSYHVDALSIGYRYHF